MEIYKDLCFTMCAFPFRHWMKNLALNFQGKVLSEATFPAWSGSFGRIESD